MEKRNLVLPLALLSVTLIGASSLASAQTSSMRSSSVAPSTGRVFTLGVETGFSTIEANDDDETSEISTTKVKPVASFEYKFMKFTGYVPFTWAKIDPSNSAASARRSESSVRIVGRPDLSAHFKLNDDKISLGLGTKLPMFSVSQGDADYFRVGQIYTQAKVRQPVFGTSDLFADAKIEKDLTKTMDGYQEGDTFELERPFMFRGELGAQTSLNDSVALGTSLRGAYSLSRGTSTSTFRGTYQSTEIKRDLGGVRYTSVNVFSDIQLGSAFNIRTNLSKAITTSKNDEGTMIATQSIDEIDQMADLALTLGLIGRF